MELKELRNALEGMEDPQRTDRGHILHKLEDIIIIGLCTLLCNGEDVVDMEAFWELREGWLRTFLTLPHGGYQTVTHSSVYLNGWPESVRQSACMIGWVCTGKKIP